MLGSGKRRNTCSSQTRFQFKQVGAEGLGPVEHLAENQRKEIIIAAFPFPMRIKEKKGVQSLSLKLWTWDQENQKTRL